MKTRKSKKTIMPINFSEEEEFIKVIGHLRPIACDNSSTSSSSGGGGGQNCSPSVLFPYSGPVGCIAACTASGDCTINQQAAYYCTDCTIGVGAGCNMGGCVTGTNACSMCNYDNAQSGCLTSMQILPVD